MNGREPRKALEWVAYAGGKALPYRPLSPDFRPDTLYAAAFTVVWARFKTKPKSRCWTLYRSSERVGSFVSFQSATRTAERMVFKEESQP